MSYCLVEIWQHPAHLPPIKSYGDAVRSLEEAETVPMVRPSQAFVALGSALVRTWPSADMLSPDDLGRRDTIWVASPKEVVYHLGGTSIWRFGPPLEEVEAVTLKLLEEARRLGLTVIDVESEIVWLPSGQIFPSYKEQDWKEYAEEFKTWPKTRTSASIRKITRDKLTTLLEKIGFEPSQDNRHFEGSDFYFVRRVEVGQQVIFGTVRPRGDKFFLSLACKGDENHAENILKHVFGVRFNGEYFFGCFRQLGYEVDVGDGMELGTDAQSVAALKALEQGAVQALELGRDIRGLDRMLNHPDALPGHKGNLSAYVQSRNYVPLVVAWLANSQHFDEVVESYRKRFSEFQPDRFDNGDRESMPDLHLLVQYLRSEVKPLVSAGEVAP